MAVHKDKTVEILTPDQYVKRAGFEVTRCRGGQHDWPSSHMVPGEEVPAGVTIWKYAEGDVQMVEECNLGCGKKRVTWLASGGLMGNELDRGYRDPKGWVRVPRAAGMTKHDWRKAFFQAVSTDLMAIARQIGNDGEDA